MKIISGVKDDQGHYRLTIEVEKTVTALEQVIIPSKAWAESDANTSISAAEREAIKAKTEDEYYEDAVKQIKQVLMNPPALQVDARISAWKDRVL